MLLTADADRLDLAAAGADFLEAFRDGFLRGVDPGLGILFDMAGRQTCDRVVGFLCKGKHSAGLDVEDESFGAFGSAIDSETKHDREGSEIGSLG